VYDGRFDYAGNYRHIVLLAFLTLSDIYVEYSF
jgi:hypothetical protein